MVGASHVTWLSLSGTVQCYATLARARMFLLQRGSRHRGGRLVEACTGMLSILS
jgi:hypothetical protein